MFRALVIVATLAGPAAAAPCSETARTSAGVQCVEDHWERAYLGGDSAYLMALLGDDYRSYRGDGTPRDRAAIVQASLDHAKLHANEPPPKVSADIQLHGDVAVVFWKNPDGSLAEIDAFAWSAGHWRAWYSQHAQAKP